MNPGPEIVLLGCLSDWMYFPKGEETDPCFSPMQLKLIQLHALCFWMLLQLTDLWQGR